MSRFTGTENLSSIVLPLKNLPDHVRTVMRDSYYVPTPAEREDIRVILHATVEKKRKHTRDSTAGRMPSGPEDSLGCLCKSALSTIRRIPREILEDFILTWWSGLDDSDKGWNYYRGLVTIMLVCRRWRDVVQSHQRLWSSLFISGQMAFQGSERLGYLMQAHQRFCPEYPWSVSLVESSIGYPSHPEAFASLVLDTRDRWRGFTLDILNDKLIQMLFAPPCPFPLLNRLCIQACGDTRIHLTPSDAPALQEVTLLSLRFPLISLPWSQLTTLVTGAISERDLGPLILQLTNVKTLKMEPQLPIAVSQSLTYETTHALRTLCVHFPYNHSLLKATLRRLRIPHLQSLRLTQNGNAVFSALKMFFSHPPHRSLTSLSLTFSLFNLYSAQNLISVVLLQLPNLQSLVLSTWTQEYTLEGTTTLLTHLQQFDEDDVENHRFKLCPNLNSLGLDNLEISDLTLGETLRARGDSLTALELTRCEMLKGEECESVFDEREIRDGLRSFCRDGQWLKVTHLARLPDT